MFVLTLCVYLCNSVSVTCLCVFHRHELLEEARRLGLPFAQWDGPTVVVWLEVGAHLNTIQPSATITGKIQSPRVLSVMQDPFAAIS